MQITEFLQRLTSMHMLHQEDVLMSSWRETMIIRSEKNVTFSKDLKIIILEYIPRNALHYNPSADKIECDDTFNSWRAGISEKYLMSFCRKVIRW